VGVVVEVDNVGWTTTGPGKPTIRLDQDESRVARGCATDTREVVKLKT
jgi:hypothetical protein